MLLSLLRLTRGSTRRLAALLLVLTYAWAFVALDITHNHMGAQSQVARVQTGALGTATPTHAQLSHRAVVQPEAPCPVCAAVHAATTALAQPPAPFYARASSPHRGASGVSFIAPSSPSTLHLRGPPQA